MLEPQFTFCGPFIWPDTARDGTLCAGKYKLQNFLVGQTKPSSTSSGFSNALHQGLASCDPRASSSPLPIFVTKVLLAHSHTRLSSFCLWLPSCCNHNWSVATEICGLLSLNYFFYSPLQKMFAGPCNTGIKGKSPLSRRPWEGPHTPHSIPALALRLWGSQKLFEVSLQNNCRLYKRNESNQVTAFA